MRIMNAHVGTIAPITLPVITLTPEQYRNYDYSSLWTGCYALVEWLPERVNYTPEQFAGGSNFTTARAVSIWNEAHNEHAARELQQLDRSVDWAVAINDWSAEDVARAARKAPEDTLTHLRAIIEAKRYAERDLASHKTMVETLATELAAANNRVETFRNQAQAQITDGSDYRLAEFWERAMANAEEEGYCSEYDRMAEALGGPRRPVETEVEVTVTLSFRTTVNAREDDDLDEEFDEEAVIEHLYSASRSDIRYALNEHSVQAA